MIIHRKGYVAQLKGTMQATCVFQPGSIIRGTNVSNINPTDILILVANLLKIPVEKVQNCLISWYKDYINQENTTVNFFIKKEIFYRF